MGNKFNASNYNRLRQVSDADRSIDDKVESFYEQHRANHNDNLASTNELSADLKKLYRSTLGPIVSLVLTFIKNSIKPSIVSLLKFVHARIGAVGWVFGALVLVLGLAAVNLFGGSTAENVASTDQTAVQGATVGSPVAAAQPDFSTLDSPTADQIKYDPELQVASYADDIAGATVVVSQQQITTEQASDDLFLLEVAQSFSLQTEFSTDKGPLFIGDNSEQQIQTAIFSYDSKLVFLQIQQVLEPDSLIEYVNSLQ